MNIRIKNIDSGELKGTIIPIFENKISKLSGDDDILKSIPFEGKADEVFYTIKEASDTIAYLME